MKSTAAHRTQIALDHLLKGHSGSATVAHVAETCSISRRQSQRYVAAAYQQLSDEIEGCGISRREMTAQLVHGLQEAMAKALATNHTSSVVGAARELRELLELTAISRTCGN